MQCALVSTSPGIQAQRGAPFIGLAGAGRSNTRRQQLQGSPAENSLIQISPIFSEIGRIHRDPTRMLSLRRETAISDLKSSSIIPRPESGPFVAAHHPLGLGRDTLFG
jgi:hypothetical protein